MGGAGRAKLASPFALRRNGRMRQPFFHWGRTLFVTLGAGVLLAHADEPFLRDPLQILERTAFQTIRPWAPAINLRSDVAIVYGIDPALPGRLQTWRDHGYEIHVMTGVSWGHYQDYLYGRFDGTDHQDEAQTERDGKKISHGGDVYYMCPGGNYGKFLCVGVQRALDAGAAAIHMEEPEFWVRAGYSAGFQREWRQFYQEPWQPPHASADAQWRASKLKYFLYRRALQQVFDHIQAFNRRTGRSVRCYVPTHSLLNYAHWRIVSPESSLARLHGCDGYIAQVWTGTARTPNLYRGRLQERTFDTAFLEYGVMQNLVAATARRVWFLADPVEDNPNHDWGDYRRNWEATLTASLLHPEVWRYEVMPWPGRVFTGKHPRRQGERERVRIPAPYATELQTVINALNDLHQTDVAWEHRPPGVGVLVSDSLMFERGGPAPSDPHLSHFYGLALPLLKRGVPVRPVQLENLPLPDALAGFQLLLLSYHGQKPLSPDVHPPLAAWVKAGGRLLVWDDDQDPFCAVREWWNQDGRHYATPRQHLFAQLGLATNAPPGRYRVGRGAVLYQAADPAALARDPAGDLALVRAVRRLWTGRDAASEQAAALPWGEFNHLLLRRGPYLIGAGLEESVSAPPRKLTGRFVNLFDPELKLRREIELKPGVRCFLLDLDRAPADGPVVLAAAGKVLPVEAGLSAFTCRVEGVAGTRAVVLLRVPDRPRHVTLGGLPLTDWRYAAEAHLLWLKFPHQATARKLVVAY